MVPVEVASSHWLPRVIYFEEGITVGNLNSTQEVPTTQTKSFTPGQVFNPHRKTCGFYAPDIIYRASGLTIGQKALYEKLVRMAGQKGYCWPSHDHLASLLSRSRRQVIYDIKKLTEVGLIGSRRRGSADGGRTSNAYWFYFHTAFLPTEPITRDQELSAISEGVKCNFRRGKVQPIAQEYIQGISSENVRKLDLDCPISSDVCKPKPKPKTKQYPRLRETLARYMTAHFGFKQYPSDMTVVEIMDKSNGASEEEVIACVAHQYNDRGLRPGFESAPESFSWFITTVQNYFRDRENREERSNPTDYPGWESRNEKMGHS